MTSAPKKKLCGGLERHKVRSTIRGNRVSRAVHSDNTRSASHMASQAGRRLLAAASAQGYEVESWDVPCTSMLTMSDPRFRLTIQQTLCANGSLVAPGKVCILRKVMPGQPDANAPWGPWSDRWIIQWGWTKPLAEPSMPTIATKHGTFRMEVNMAIFWSAAHVLKIWRRSQNHSKKRGITR